MKNESNDEIGWPLFGWPLQQSLQLFCIYVIMSKKAMSNGGTGSLLGEETSGGQHYCTHPTNNVTAIALVFSVELQKIHHKVVLIVLD